MDATSRTKVWLKVFADNPQDSWWRVTPSKVTRQLIKILNFELGHEQWVLLDSGALRIVFDWSGDISEVSPDIVIMELDHISELYGLPRWMPLSNLTQEQLIWVLFNITDYRKMTK